MRKPGLLSMVLFLAVAPGAFAQQKNALSVFLSDPFVSYNSTSGTKASSGFGIAFDRMFTPRVSAQLAIASERAHTYPYIVTSTGAIVPVTRRSFRVFPVDLTVRYHFLNDTRWKPYLLAGVHYVGAPNVGSEFGYQNHLGSVLGGGTVFQIRRSFGIVLDGKAVFSDRENYERVLRSSIGFDWRF